MRSGAVGSSTARGLRLHSVQSPEGITGQLAIEYFPTPEFSGKPLALQTTHRSQIEWSDNFLKGANPQEFSARLTGVFIAPESGNYTFSLTGDGSSKLLLDGQVIVDRWQDHQLEDTDPWSEAENSGVIGLLQGQNLQLTILFTWKGQSPWRMITIGCLPPMPDNPIASAEKLAASSEVAIVFAGLTKEWESEGFDRVDMDLPREQNQLISRVAAVNPNSGSPLGPG